MAIAEDTRVNGRPLRFLLVPDGSAARRLRRVLAEQGAISGLVVGMWPELMEWACRAYLVPEDTDDNDSSFKRALEEFKAAFWSERACRLRLWKPEQRSDWR